MDDSDGLIASFRLDGTGGGVPMSWQEISEWTDASGTLWVHLRRDAEPARRWLENESGLDAPVVESLLAESTRPRCVPFGVGVMLFLRGVNLNPGADPEDMVSIRLWVEPTRIISVRTRRLLSVDDLRAALERGDGPRTSGEFVVQLADHLVSRVSGIIADVDDEVDRLQDEVLESNERTLRTELTRLRREIIALPQNRRIEVHVPPCRLHGEANDQRCILWIAQEMGFLGCPDGSHWPLSGFLPDRRADGGAETLYRHADRRDRR